jgi:DNA repair exonuclease SbcCD ATPase subunit
MLKLLKAFLGIDTELLDSEYKEIYEQRTGYNKTAETIKPFLTEKQDSEQLVARKTEVEEKIAAAEPKKQEIHVLTERINNGTTLINSTTTTLKLNERELENINGFIANKEEQIKKLQEEIAKHKEDKVKIETTIQTAKNTLAEAVPFLDKLKAGKDTLEADVNTDLLNMELNNINKDIQNSQTNEANHNKYEEAKTKSEECTSKLKDIKGQIAQLYIDASTEELQLSEDEILYNGLPLERKQINTAGLARLALKLVMKSKPKLSSVRFDASFMDTKTFKEVMEEINNSDFQAFIEMVDKDSSEVKIEILETLNNPLI